MARFLNLDPESNYDILDSESGLWLTQGISGCIAMLDDDWPEGSEAYPANEPDAEWVETAQ